MSAKETLHIKNFFSIADFQWEVKGFNVLTGGMASGKSLCMKLLSFMEQVFHETIFVQPVSRDVLQKVPFYERLDKQFNLIFHSNNPEADFKDTELSYNYSNNGNTFDLRAKWGVQSLVWESAYIDKRLDQWRNYFEIQHTPDMAKIVRNHIYEEISDDFAESFPVGVMFIPAARAIAAITDKTDFQDRFLFQFISELKEFVLSFGDISNNDVNEILHIENISLDESKIKTAKTPLFDLSDGRKISALELSSGQQELLYLLLVLRDLPRTSFYYGKGLSVFIEEPSAHLFPLEQKQTLEFIVRTFQDLQNKKQNCRFFISTHSPYILNVFNNILNKGRLQERIEAITDSPVKVEQQAKLDALLFPHLSVADVSAYMIESSGHVKPMITGRKDDEYLYSEVLEQITQDINAETDVLYELGKEMRRYEKGKEK